MTAQYIELTGLQLKLVALLDNRVYYKGTENGGSYGTKGKTHSKAEIKA